MSPSGVDIRDLHSLEELYNVIEYSAEAMANIEENVDSYINKVLDVLKQQEDAIHECLEEAKRALSDAESALSSCYSSQSYDEESRTYRPSCSCYENAVESAKMEVEKWESNYEHACRIVSDCSSEISNYHTSGGIAPPGGHYLIYGMCNHQRPKITEQLRQFIDDAYEYLGHNVGGELLPDHKIVNPNVSEDDLPRSEDDKKRAFIDKIEGVKREQKSESFSRNIQDANRAMHCPDCGKPLALCTCRIRHVNVNLYEKK